MLFTHAQEQGNFIKRSVFLKLHIETVHICNLETLRQHPKYAIRMPTTLRSNTGLNIRL